VGKNHHHEKRYSKSVLYERFLVLYMCHGQNSGELLIFAVINPATGIYIPMMFGSPFHSMGWMTRGPTLYRFTQHNMGEHVLPCSPMLCWVNLYNVVPHSQLSWCITPITWVYGRYTMWCPPVISRFINPINYSCKYHKP